MRKYSFSSQKRKPLFIASLAVSLALHAGGLYFLFKHPLSFFSSKHSEERNQTLAQELETDLEIEFALTETLNRLIIKEEQHAAPIFDRPQLEMTDQKLNIITNFAYTPEVSSSAPPPPFHLETPNHFISKSDEYVTLKPSAFGPKKWINFSQRLEVELSPLASAKEPNALPPESPIQPKLEKQDKFSKFQETGKISLAPSEATADTSLTFTLPKEPASEIITPEVKLKKQETKTKAPLEKPLTLSPLAKTQTQSSKNISSIDPTIEKRKSQTFDKETFYFFYSGEQESTYPPKLQTTKPLAKALNEKFFSPPKKTLLPKTFIGQHFFASIAPLDLSPFSEEHESYITNPFHEEVARQVIPKKKLPQATLPELSSSQLLFESSTLDLPSYPFKYAVKKPVAPLEKTLGSTFPLELPDLPEDALTTYAKSNQNYLPEKEHIRSLDVPERFKWQRQNQIVSTPPSSSFEISIESETLCGSNWMSPKQELTLTFSNISLPKSSYVPTSSSTNTVVKQANVTPKKEQVQTFAYTNSLEALMSQIQLPSYEENSSIALSPQASFECALALRKLDFPRASLQAHQSNWEQMETPEFMPYFETQIAIKQTEPRQEEVKQIQPESTLALDLDSVDLKEKKLYKPDDVGTLPLSPSRSSLPKQKLSKLPSALSMKQEVFTPEASSYDRLALAKGLQPQEELFSFNLEAKPAAELSHPTIPLYLMKRFPEKSPQFDLTETPMNVTPRGQRTPALATLPKGNISVSPTPIEKNLLLNAPPTLVQAALDKPITTPKKETALSSIPQREHTKPQIPSVDISKGPLLDFDGGNVAIKENEFDIYKHDLEVQEHLAMPCLPDLTEKKVLPSKAPFKMTNTLTDLPEAEKFLSLVPRQESFANTKRLLSNMPFPHRETPEPVQLEASKAKEIKNVTTADIQSQAKELIKKHHEESLAQNMPVDISTPQLKKTLSEKDFHTINETGRFTQGYLSEIPAVASLDTISFNNDFETTVTYVEKPDGKGYNFALKIKPSEKLYLGSPQQNFIFIVDGSGTIKKHRYNTFKDAVVKSLAYMHDGDSFNILVADSQIAAMSEKPLVWSKGTISKVRKYLETRSYRGYFSNYDAFHLLSKASKYFDPNKENIVILLTDGHSLESITAHKESLRSLAEDNKGHFSLFTASASQGNNIAMLDLISAFNNGEFMYSPTNAAFPRKLAVLVKHIESFIAKDIRIHVTSSSNNLDVQFYPNRESYPSLYADHPYTLYGSIDKLEDFDLIIQGKSGDQWVNIKQRVTFQNAEKAGFKLKRNFALQQAYACYDYYLKKDDPFFLAEAERILTPHAIAPATR